MTEGGAIPPIAPTLKPNTMKFDLIKEIVPLFNVKELTKEEVLNHEKREYNPQAWERQVEGMYKRQSNVRFFEKTTNKMSYPELYAMYTISEGITFFSPFSYGGSITNAGFAEVHLENDEIKTLKPFSEGLIANNKLGREYMAQKSAMGYVYSNALPLSTLVTEEIEIP